MLILLTSSYSFILIRSLIRLIIS